MNKNMPSITIDWQSNSIGKLIKKYEKQGPRYTSYPPATFFSPFFADGDYIKQVELSNNVGSANISLYFHIPFCPQLCHFCGCNTDIIRSNSFIERYIDAILQEFETVTRYIDKSRKVSQIHWGGGTPNAISLRHVARIMNKISETFTLTPHCEVAMECNPAYLKLEHIHTLASLGFNRISVGIQDFDRDVLKYINRKTSLLPEEELMQCFISENILVNFDFVYGLPGQTAESFDRSMQRAISLSPSRIVTFSYAHVPWVKQAQKILEQYSIPNADAKFDMFGKAYNRLVEAGYVAIGLDHFAKPTDDLAIALQQQQLHRNFMGYCSRENTGQVYAFGSTAIGQLENCYSQNTKNTDAYITAVFEKGTAVEKGYQLNFRDKVCRSVIMEIMCNQYVNLLQVAASFAISLEELMEITQFSSGLISPFVSDGLVVFENQEITIQPLGRLFLRNIAMLFDPLCVDNDPRYSKTV